MQSMLKRLVVLVLALAVVVYLPCPVRAQDPDTPVAVISLVWGVVTVKHPNDDYKPARWLEPIFPGDRVKTTGAGSKLLITFFNDNHQEVMGPDCEAAADLTGLQSQSGTPIRKDDARNPFGAGGVQNPFVYTHKLVQADFQAADAPGAYDQEEVWLKGWMNSAFPPAYSWPAQAGAGPCTLRVTAAPGLAFNWQKSCPGTSYRMTQEEANAMPKGALYTWSVQCDGATVVQPYSFLLMTLPQEKWLKEQAQAFQNKRDRGQLQRSDYTDYLLVCSQLYRVDNAVSLCQEITGMDPQNPRAWRAMVRVYLARGCPAHAKQAYDQEMQLGGYDPIGL